MICILLLLFTNVSNYLKYHLEKIFFPLQAAIYKSKENVMDSFQTYLNRKKMFQENELLKLENNKLKFILRENKILLEENKRLTLLLEMKQNLTEEIQFAKVYFRKPENMYEQFYIDLGSKDGIKKNMIISQGEKLIGRVVEVQENSSLVYMITKEGIVVSAKSENHIFGVVKGIGEDKLYFEPNVYDDSLKVGDKIYTSGISDIYPGEMYIGYISEIEKGENSLFTGIVVKTSINISNLKEVLVIQSRRNYED
ncbi:rod shape-determining protein MreC [Fusobacterium necrophorum]|nr:rod shape-determining protein MreC [Fusobacterium necrophorum]